MDKKYLAALSILLLGFMLPAYSDSKYGFSSSIKRCPLWDTFFPLSFQVPDDKATRNANPQFNIIYITGGNVKHMDDFEAFYYPGAIRVWPQVPYLATGMM